MKTKSILLIVWLLMPSCLWAEDISEQEAQQIAARFLNKGDSSVAHRATAVMQLNYKTEGDELYVFNQPGGGWVVVAGDDRATSTVLAYSHEGSFDYHQAPDAAKAVIRHYADGIDSLRMMGDSHILSSRRSSTGVGTVVVEPLLKTKWNQRAPYNNLCPQSGGVNCLTGCVATAIAQIMRYWQWPQQGSGQHTNARSDQRETMDFSHSTYDWANMSDEYSGDDYSETQANAVARLMADIGTATNMGYGEGQSGAYTFDAYHALFRFFGYDESSIRVYGEFSYCDQMTMDRDDLLRQELDEARPVYYSGSSGGYGSFSSAHAFVCDGYDDQGYFHFNYGWGGSSDGYYKTTSTSLLYINQNEIITGIQPRKNERIIDNGVFYDLTDDGKAIVASSNGMPEYEGDVTIPVSVTAHGKSYTVSGIHRVALADRMEGSEVIGSPLITSLTVKGNIKEIPDRSFRECGSLKSVILEDGVETIGYKAFAECAQLGKVVIGNSVTEIKEMAFMRCPALSDLSVGKNVRSIGSYAFELCKGLTSYLSLGEKLESVEDNAFRDCLGLQGVDFPATIKFIGNRAFCGCSMLTSAWFSPEAHDFVIDVGAFYASPQVYVSGLEHAAEIREGAIGSSGMTGSFTVQPTCKYGRGAVSGKFDQIILPAKLTSFDVNSVTGAKAYVVEKGNPYFYANNGVLYDRKMTTLLSYPNNGEISVTVPAGVETIGAGAFHHTIYYMTLPGSVKTLEEPFFTQYREVTCLSKTPPVINNVETVTFPYNDYTGKYYIEGVLKVPNGCKTAYEQAEVWKLFNTIADDAIMIQGRFCYEINGDEARLLCRNSEVEYDGIVNDIPASITMNGKSYNVTYIDANAFRGDTQLKSITFGGNIYSVGEASSYDNCLNLERVTIGKSVEYFGQNYVYAAFFQNCPKLAEISVESGNKYFFSEDGILYYNLFGSEPYYMATCPAMREENGSLVPRTTAIVSDRIQQISNHVFTKNLRNVVIPSSINFIDGDAFAECTQLKTVTLLVTDPASITLYSTSVFDGIKEVLPGFNYRYHAVLQVPVGTKSLYENADVWKDFESIVEITPDNFNPEAGDDGSFDSEDVTEETVTALVILTKDGSSQTFELAERPVVTIAGTNLKVVSNTADVTFPLNEIVRYTFFKRTATDIEKISSVKEEVDYKDGVLTMTDLKAGSIVNVYAIDGRLVQSATVPQDGTYRHSFSSLGQGVYIVKVNNLSYKILKR